LRMLIEWAIP